MVLTIKQMSLITAFFGICALILGVIAENKKPAAGTLIPGKGVVICKYPGDLTVFLGFASFVALLASAGNGFFSLYYPYNRRGVPKVEIHRSPTMKIFHAIAWVTTALAALLLLWPTITSFIHLGHGVHHNLNYACPTAKTGLLGGGALLSLNSCLLWLVCVLLASNARQDYLEELDSARDVELTQVIDIGAHSTTK